MHWSRLEELVLNSPIHDLGLFDAGRLLSELHRVAVGIGGQYNQWLDRALALLAWSEQRSGADLTGVCERENGISLCLPARSA